MAGVCSSSWFFALMRDRRFVAAHRGGLLRRDKHRLLAAWAADCAERVLPLFERTSSDERPRCAVAIARAWAKGEVSVGQAQKAAVGAHAAARGTADREARAAARAAGHAVATAHMADHCLGAVFYALKALEGIPTRLKRERAWQIKQLPEEMRELVISALESRFSTRRGIAT